MHAADIKTQNNSSLPNEALQYFLSVNDSLCGRVSSCYATWCNRTCTQKQHQMSERCAGHSTIYAPTHKSFRAHAHTLLRAIALTLHKSRVVPQSVSQSVIQSETLSKQSASLSKHVNPPTSSLFPWTLAAVCSSTLVLSWVHTHMHTGVSAL